MVLKNLLKYKSYGVIWNTRRLYLSQTYFQYNNKFYLQNSDGPLRPLLAGLFFSHIEKQFIKSQFGKALIHFRCIDDILVCFKGSYRYLILINEVHPNIYCCPENYSSQITFWIYQMYTRKNSQITFKVNRAVHSLLRTRPNGRITNI